MCKWEYNVKVWFADGLVLRQSDVETYGDCLMRNVLVLGFVGFGLSGCDSSIMPPPHMRRVSIWSTTKTSQMRLEKRTAHVSRHRRRLPLFYKCLPIKSQKDQTLMARHGLEWVQQSVVRARVARLIIIPAIALSLNSLELVACMITLVGSLARMWRIDLITMTKQLTKPIQAIHFMFLAFLMMLAMVSN